MMNEFSNSITKRIVGSVLAFLLLATVFVVAPVESSAKSLNSSASRRPDKRLSSKETKMFVKNMQVEMDIVIYPIMSFEKTQSQREEVIKRFGARGSMKRKTRKAIAEMFNADVMSVFTDREISDQIVAAVNRLVEREEARK